MRAAILFLACWSAVAGSPAEWSRPFPAHKIAGNIYFVGTEDLACFLVTGPSGHILINTGLVDSVKQIRAGVEKLGFRFEDIKILLTMQSHYDHMAGMAEIAKLTGAQVYATEADAPIIEAGGRNDPALGREGWFPPVKVHRRLKDGETVALGPIQLKLILTPGHTPGSASYSTTVQEGGQSYDFLFVNLGTVIMPLVGNAKYPGIVADFEKTFAVQKTLRPHIWVAAHGSQYRMKDKLNTGSFADTAGYFAAVAATEQSFRQRLAREQAGRPKR